ncbi:T9SS sorting signal type C domain-containing protein [Flavobacterium sp. KACC 22761]|uniref:T9SS sorting signal type C domain-containing protein n=1 Tax=Flavobacterium sp. KACC 22761 TaxID=3092665 RepID=UPI002A74A4D5|nr:T9SS sorting signal type C domain-containing protein [Flavobacterium sp. KACC 22761]WPO79905.1 T9SS sorting signal type C domain-containing protein [Flavobacterium sp. KACC 22761]
MIRKLLLSFLFFLLSFFTFGKNTSDLNITTIRANYISYKTFVVAGTITSTSTGGSWSSPSSWVGGVVPSATDDVVIASGATITISGSTSNAKTLTINGNLLVSNTVTLNSVTQVTINGLLSFEDQNSNIHLPANTGIKINSPGKVDDSKCSNNVAIYIGSTKFAACTGNGGQPIYKSFTDLNNSGGTINAIASSNSPVCLNGTINLSGSYSGTVGNTTSTGSTSGVNYSWSVQAPNGTTTTSNLQNYNLPASQTGNYTATLTCTTYYGSDLYTSTSTITVVVNANMGVSAASSSQTLCVGTPMTNITHTTTGGVTGIGTPSPALPAGVTASWASNTITISGTPSASGTFNYSIPVLGCGTTVNATGTITVNANVGVSAASSSQTLCVGTPMTNITHTTTGGVTGIGTPNPALPAGVTASWASNTITISGTPSASGTFNYSIPVLGCGTTVNATGTITVNANNTITLTSASGTNAQSICKDSAITNITYTTTGATGANFTGLPAGVTGGWASNTVTISGTPTTTVDGTFNYTVTLLNGCGNVTATGTITVAVPNRGQVHGGKHICLGDDSPQLYMSTFSGTIVKWQYSDDPAESSGSWIDIPNTANLTTYQPAKLTALRTFRTVVQNGACPPETAIQTRIDVDTTPTFTVSPSATSCPNTDVTYTTQSGQGNYIWTVSGTLGTDYSITSGGVGTSSNSVTLKWLTAGSKTVTVTYSNACSNNPVASSTTTVDDFSISPAQSTSFCINTQITPITYIAKGFDGIGSGSFSLPSGLTVNYDNTTKTLTISGIPTTQGTFNYTIPLTASGCTISGEAKGTIIINATPTAPSASVSTQPTCSGTKGTITITATAGYTYSINGTDYYNQTVFSSLDPGSYTVTAKNTSGCISAGTPLQVNAPTAKTWTGANSADWSLDSNWSPTGVPTASDCVIIPTGVAHNPIISGTDGNFYAYTLTVNDQGNLTVKSSNTLQVTSSVNVLSSGASSGTLLFEDSSSLIQTSTSNTINTGNITYNRIAKQIRQADYVYWSTPVKNQTLAALSPLTSASKLYAYDGTKWVFTPRTTVMTAGKGYIVRGPETYSNTVKQDFPASFIGIPQNGTFQGESMVGGQFYLLGNPYPSALNADAFITETNNKTILEGTLYFWTHNTPVVLSGAYEYSTDDYATYNLSGGTGTGPAPSAFDPNLDSPRTDFPSGKIGAGQAFFVGTVASGKAVFNNSMRVSGNNTQFFKPGKTSKTAEIEKHRVWLNMTNAGGAFKQLLVGYIEGATNNYERLYDGTSFDGNKYLDFYSINDGNNLAIQGRALPFTDTDMVPLGYRSTIAGDFTISIDYADGNMKTQKIYLEDKTTGEIHDLTQSNYTFTTKTGTFTDRFVLRYTNKTLGTGDFENIENGVLISVKDKTVKVISSIENLKEINIYDISGKLLYNKTKVNSTELQIPNLQSSDQVLIVKVTLENNFTVSKKIIFQ